MIVAGGVVPGAPERSSVSSVYNLSVTICKYLSFGVFVLVFLCFCVNDRVSLGGRHHGGLGHVTT